MFFLPKCITMICETDLHHFNLENFSRSNQLITQQYCIHLILHHLFHAANENQLLKALSFPHWLPWKNLSKLDEQSLLQDQDGESFSAIPLRRSRPPFFIIWHCFFLQSYKLLFWTLLHSKLFTVHSREPKFIDKLPFSCFSPKQFSLLLWKQYERQQ